MLWVMGLEEYYRREDLSGVDSGKLIEDRMICRSAWSLCGDAEIVVFNEVRDIVEERGHGSVLWDSYGGICGRTSYYCWVRAFGF